LPLSAKAHFTRGIPIDLYAVISRKNLRAVFSALPQSLGFVIRHWQQNLDDRGFGLRWLFVTEIHLSALITSKYFPIFFQEVTTFRQYRSGGRCEHSPDVLSALGTLWRLV
jgi:hypothetical protein